MFGVTGQYAASSEKVAGVDDGSIANVEVRGNIEGFGLKAGYITTDKTGGAGTMSALGDNISPFEEGNQVYASDAKTYYVGAEYEISGIALGALYGKTTKPANDESEFNFSVGYSVNEQLGLGAVYINVDNENAGSDYNKYYLTANYSF